MKFTIASLLVLCVTSLSAGNPPTQPENLFSFDLEYSVWSDYVFRGVNNSEYVSEGRERPDHQLSFQVNTDLGVFGSVYFNTWLNWFPVDGQDLTEVDYTFGWAYNVEPIYTEVALQYVFYTYPNAKPINSQEISLALTHNDAWAWQWLWPDNEDPVLTPFFMIAYDTDYAKGKVWMELGLRHDFKITDDFTVTPLMVFAIDGNGYLQKMGGLEDDTSGLAYIQFGIELDYDITDLLHCGDWATASVGGFVYYNEAVGDAADSGAIDEEFFGGIALRFSF